MKIIKILPLLFLLFLVTETKGQLHYNLGRIIRKNQRIAKRNLIFKDNFYLSFIEKIYGLPYIYSIDYLPISSFSLSRKAILYDGAQSIVNYIVLNKKHSLQGFYTLKKGSYEGYKSLNNLVYFNGKGFSSGYDTSKVFTNYYDEITLMYNTLKALQKRNFEFLFAVKYFRDAIWFIENKEVYLIDIKELKVYDPDEYIRIKCSINTIRNLASGKVDAYCG